MYSRDIRTCAGYVLTGYTYLRGIYMYTRRPAGAWVVKERIHCNIAKLAHKSIYDTECPIKLNNTLWAHII